MGEFNRNSLQKQTKGMKKLVRPLTNFEAVIELIVQPPSAFSTALKADGKEPPKPIKILALIDTGFTCGLAIEQSVLEGWGLKIRNFNRVSLPREEGRLYSSYAWEADVAIKFLDASPKGENVLIDPIPATILEFVADDNVKAIIGQELLQTAIFVYNGPKGNFSLEFSKRFII